jgi:hypothetical protein
VIDKTVCDRIEKLEKTLNGIKRRLDRLEGRFSPWRPVPQNHVISAPQPLQPEAMMPTLGLRAAARQLGISHVGLLKAESTGRVPKRVNGLFDIDACRKALGRQPMGLPN